MMHIGGVAQSNRHPRHGQSCVPPHPSDVGPQSAGVHVTGVQHVPALQVSVDAHIPHSKVPGQVPLVISPHSAPCATQLVGVQHVPNFAPGALTHSPLFPLVPQQLRLVRQTAPSALHGSAVTSRRPAKVSTTVATRTRPPRATCVIGHLLVPRERRTAAPVTTSSFLRSRVRAGASCSRGGAVKR